MSDLAEDIRRDVEAIGRIDAIPMLLKIVADTTGMGFAAVARVTDGTWTACAVHDLIEFNLKPGGQLDVSTTLCKEVRAASTPVVIDHASQDPAYCEHITPRTYSIESYISVPIVLPDGHYFGNLCAIDPRPAKLKHSGALTMFTSFAQLIALQLDAERRRELDHAALADERAASTMREQFIAVLSHDLRNPLAAVAACGNVLRIKSDQPAVVADIAARIDRSVTRMSTLIDESLDLVRARLGGGIGVTRAPVDDLAARLTSVVNELRDVWPHRALHSRIELPARVWCDAGRVQQMLSNLLSNALVHGARDGAVSVSAHLEGGEMVLSVNNQGDAITPEIVQQMFTPFWRRQSTRDSGLGLGLYICAQIAKAHGGTLSVSSTAEAGTTFTARLPVTA